MWYHYRDVLKTFLMIYYNWKIQIYKELFLKEQLLFILFELEHLKKHLFELEHLPEHLIGELFGARIMS